WKDNNRRSSSGSSSGRTVRGRDASGRRVEVTKPKRLRKRNINASRIRGRILWFVLVEGPPTNACGRYALLLPTGDIAKSPPNPTRPAELFSCPRDVRPRMVLQPRGEGFTIVYIPASERRKDRQPMSPEGSVSHWLGQLQAGDHV